MISDPYTAMAALLHNNATLTALLGTFQGTAIPLITGEDLAETETNLPGIAYELEPSNKQNRTLGDYNFLLNIYTATKREGAIIANTILEEFDGCQLPVDGYFTQTTCSILTQVTDPTSKQVNTPVEFRLVNI